MGVSKDSEFCKIMDIKPSTVSSWRNRNSIPYEMIAGLSQSANFSLDYVLKGIPEIKINYKDELIKTIKKLEPNQIEYLYYIAKSEQLRTKK